MVTPRTILLPTDFTGRCDRSRDRAVLLARAWGARLVLLHVLENDATIPWDREEAMDRAQAKLESEVQDDNIAICTRVAFGDVTSTILDVAAEFSVELIVTGISRKDELGDFLIGTTVERLARRAGLPLLIVKGRAEAEYRQLMAATDFSECSRTALTTAVDLFPTAAITLLHAYHVRLETLRGREGPAAAQQADIAYELDAFLSATALSPATQALLDVSVDYGDVCRVARDHVQANAVDLAVIGTHGRSALATAMLGSTARALVGCLECDVLLVPQDSRASEPAQRIIQGIAPDDAG
ncbi:universal stress protein [Sphingopyxis granuli]|uniref:universal stress protein n=1 Tax=Sphingopyxis granuli TaxID=267128 RepID=UPI000835E7BF|nr:universal stress protein [Sphingopyxis granuli]